MIISEEEYCQRLSYVQNLCPGTKYVPLKTNEKRPSTPHGHLDATTEVPYTENWGIVRDGMYVVLDFDRCTAARPDLESLCSPTWSQRTPRENGVHYLYILPKDLQTLPGSVPLLDSRGERVGEILTTGAFPGPGSRIDSRAYRLVSGVAPTICPDWVLTRLLEAARGLRIDSRASAEFDVLLDGQGRDLALYKFASLARRIGWSQKGIEAILASVVLSGAIEQPEGSEHTQEDILRLARSACRHSTDIPPSFQIISSNT